MPGPAPHGSIEVVRGGMPEEVAAEVRAFWADRGALTGAAAHARLLEVLCVQRDAAGAVVGVNSAYPADLPLVGGRRFWVYRALLDDPGRDEAAMERAAFAALAEDQGTRAAAVGLCLLLSPEEARRRPEAQWPDPRTVYAGYLEDGRQVRVAYFPDARIGPGLPEGGGSSPEPAPLEEGYRIALLGEQDVVGEQEVLDLWEREGVVGGDEARRRVAEVLLVATDAAGALVGVSTAYLRHNRQLRMDLWYYRAFVAAAHRQSAVAVNLAVTGRNLLADRHAAGEASGARGIAYEVENEGLKRYFNHAHWLPADFLFVGENDRGDHVRVHLFDGVVAPPPPA